MSSQEDIIEAVLECSNKINLPTWLSISCVFDENKKVMLGYNDNMSATEPIVYGDFELVIKNLVLYTKVQCLWLTQNERY